MISYNGRAHGVWLMFTSVFTIVSEELNLDLATFCMAFHQQEDSSANEIRGIQSNTKFEGEGIPSLAGYIEKLLLKEILAIWRSFQVISFWKAPRLVQRMQQQWAQIFREDSCDLSPYQWPHE